MACEREQRKMVRMKNELRYLSKPVTYKYLSSTPGRGPLTRKMFSTGCSPEVSCSIYSGKFSKPSVFMRYIMKRRRANFSIYGAFGPVPLFPAFFCLLTVWKIRKNISRNMFTSCCRASCMLKSLLPWFFVFILAFF